MKNTKLYNIDPDTFADILHTKKNDFPPLAQKAIKHANFKYRLVEGSEYEQAILKTIKTIGSKDLKTSGPHRLDDWEKGWAENLQEFRKDDINLNRLIPKFVRKREHIRFQGKLISPESDSFETDFVSVMRYVLFHKYFKDVDTLYEFGAGTGLNLVAAAKIFPNLKLVGLDWAKSSIDIIATLKEKLPINISGVQFNLFEPEEKYHLDKNSAVLTIGTLEQLGTKFETFMQYLLKNRPKICIHFETLYELYDQASLVDYLAIKYLEKRGYLRGFVPYLEKLVQEKKIKIIEMGRTFGSFYHEGYSYLVWKPL